MEIMNENFMISDKAQRSSIRMIDSWKRKVENDEVEI
jgi:hypothetical protein